MLSAVTVQAVFQSALRSRDRSDPEPARAAGELQRFNPRPGLATGATSRWRSRPAAWAVSIRAPVSRPGRLDGWLSGLTFEGVSIRAPVSRPGRPRTARLCSAAAWFQSAPRSRDRGDARALRLAKPPQLFQSAPRSRDRGDVNGTVCVDCKRAFQSAPRSRDRGDHGARIPRHILTSFNPRPGLATGATRRRRAWRRWSRVSIRAPVSRPGRRLMLVK